MSRRLAPRNSADLFVGGLLVLIILGVVAIGFVLRDNSESSLPKPSLSTTSTPLAVPSLGDAHGEEGVGPCELGVSELQRLSRELVTAWGLLEPSDTTTIRRERLAPLVANSFFASQNVEVYSELPAEKARQQSGTREFAKATTEPEVVCATSTSDEAATSATITKWQEQKGVRVGPSTTSVVSVHWIREGAVWQADALEETQP